MYIAITKIKDGAKTIEAVKKVEVIDRFTYNFITFDNDKVTLVVEHAKVEDSNLVNVKRYNEEIVEKDLEFLMMFFNGVVATLDMYEREDGTFYFVQ